jgi:hypothetical protein
LCYWNRRVSEATPNKRQKGVYHLFYQFTALTKIRLGLFSSLMK